MEASQTSEFVYKPTNGSRRVQLAIARESEQMRAIAPAIIAKLPCVLPSDEERDALEALLVGQEDAEQKTGQSVGVMLAEPLRGCAGCLTAFLGSLALGKQWKTALDRAGLTYIGVTALARYDRQGFGALLKLADEAQKSILVSQMRQALHKRAVEGVENVKIGRVDKDRDGIVRDDEGNPIIERKYSDKLLEFGLSKLDKATFGEQAGQVNIGQQVIYNLQGVQFGAAPKPAGPSDIQNAEIVEAEPEAGENLAKIELDSLADVDNP